MLEVVDSTVIVRRCQLDSERYDATDLPGVECWAYEALYQSAEETMNANNGHFKEVLYTI